MTNELQVNHEEDKVVFSEPGGEKIAKISAEDAILLARNILDEAEKSLRGTVQCN